MEATLNEYQPSADYLFLEAQGLLIQDQEDAIAHRRRTGIREGESTAAFAARIRRDRADAASSVLRQDAQGKNVAAPPGGRDLSLGHAAGHDEDEEEDEEPNAAKAQADMIAKKKDGWRKPRKDRQHLAASGKEATANVEAKGQEKPLDDFDTSIHNAKSSFEARVNRPRR
jgi:hypothetical protein